MDGLKNNYPTHFKMSPPHLHHLLLMSACSLFSGFCPLAAICVRWELSLDDTDYYISHKEELHSVVTSVTDTVTSDEMKTRGVNEGSLVFS